MFIYFIIFCHHIVFDTGLSADRLINTLLIHWAVSSGQCPVDTSYINKLIPEYNKSLFVITTIKELTSNFNSGFNNIDCLLI